MSSTKKEADYFLAVSVNWDEECHSCKKPWPVDDMELQMKTGHFTCPVCTTHLYDWRGVVKRWAFKPVVRVAAYGLAMVLVNVVMWQAAPHDRLTAMIATTLSVFSLSHTMKSMIEAAAATIAATCGFNFFFNDPVFAMDDIADPENVLFWLISMLACWAVLHTRRGMVCRKGE